MTLPWDLEDWLTQRGDEVVRKEAAAGEASLTRREKLIYEIWLLTRKLATAGFLNTSRTTV